MMLISHCGTLFADILNADKGEKSIKKIQIRCRVIMCSENGEVRKKTQMICSVVWRRKYERSIEKHKRQTNLWPGDGKHKTHKVLVYVVNHPTTSLIKTVFILLDNSHARSEPTGLVMVAESEVKQSRWEFSDVIWKAFLFTCFHTVERFSKWASKLRCVCKWPWSTIQNAGWKKCISKNF